MKVRSDHLIEFSNLSNWKLDLFGRTIGLYPDTMMKITLRIITKITLVYSP